jgi:hypothetical protein
MPDITEHVHIQLWLKLRKMITETYEKHKSELEEDLSVTLEHMNGFHDLRISKTIQP